MPHVILVSSDKALESIARALCSELSLAFDVATNLNQFKKLSATSKNYQVIFDINTIDDEGAEPSDLLNSLCVGAVIISRQPNRMNILLWKISPWINHILNREDGMFEERLRNLLDKNQKQFKDFLPAATLTNTTFSDKAEMRVMLESLRVSAGSLGCCPDFPRIIQTIGHELALNSILYAPNKVQAKKVDVKFGSDGKYFWIVVTDPHGALTRERILQSLLRCSETEMCEISTTAPSAGVGLFMVYNWSAEIVFNLNAGLTTTVACRVPLARRYKDIGGHKASVHIIIPNDEGRPGNGLLSL